MHLLRGKPDYDLPNDFGEIRSIVINTNGPDMPFVVPLISADNMLRLREGDHDWMLGAPVYASILHGRLWFFPTPDDAYYAVARYIPADKEL